MPTVLIRAHDSELETLAAAGPDWLGRSIDLAAWQASPSGADEHRWIDLDPLAAIRLVPSRRARARHTAQLELLAAAGVAAEALFAVAVDFADRWTALDRVETALPRGHAAIDTARGLGFDVEVTRRARLPDGRDELLLGRLRPDFAPRSPPAPPEWSRGPRGTFRHWEFRAIEDSDAEAVRALSVEPSSLFGTLQSPSSGVDFYLERHRRPHPGNRIGLLVIDGSVAGIGGLHPSGIDDVRVLGMAIDHPWQGRGAGRLMMNVLLSEARAAGVRRLELSVFHDNTRAVALYQSFGFEVEGCRRHDGIRDGAHASSIDMARTL